VSLAAVRKEWERELEQHSFYFQWFVFRDKRLSLQMARMGDVSPNNHNPISAGQVHRRGRDPVSKATKTAFMDGRMDTLQRT